MNLLGKFIEQVYGTIIALIDLSYNFSDVTCHLSKNGVSIISVLIMASRVATTFFIDVKSTSNSSIMLEEMVIAPPTTSPVASHL